MVHDFFPFEFERGDPFVDRCWWLPGASWVAAVTVDVRHIEQVVELLIGQLDEQVSQKLSATLGDPRIAQGAGERLAHVGLHTFWRPSRSASSTTLRSEPVFSRLGNGGATPHAFHDLTGGAFRWAWASYG